MKLKEKKEQKQKKMVEWHEEKMINQQVILCSDRYYFNLV